MTNYHKSDFGNDFSWGVSTAAYQVEGGYNLDGKGPSIWDEFTARKGKIHNDENGNIACDFYHRFPRDLMTMSLMNIDNYRFSISWSRIFPCGTGPCNKTGVAYYNRLIDFCLELNITPWITLYHWDLPAALEKKGGWTNRLIIDWFSDFVSFCIRNFGDRVKNWIILNEPMVFTGAGYFLGIHAPGKKGISNFLSAMHHAALCQAEGGRVARSERNGMNIGTTFSCSHVEPFRPFNLDDHAAATKVDALLNRAYIEPLLGLGYPLKDVPILRRVEQFVKDGDEGKLAFNMDFIGVQNYTREMISHSYFTPFLRAKIIKADLRKVNRTLMNWEVYPESIYHCLKKFSAYKNIPELIVTENGAAFNDRLEEGEVNDIHRRQYIQDYLGQVLKAKDEGVNVNGYFVWSFMDNFEWAEGYMPRFGLVYVEYLTQKRVIKSSGHWYSNFLREASDKSRLRIV